MILTISNYIFTAIFSIEAAIKVMSQGFIVGSTAYLRDSWNGLDFFLLIASLLDIVLSLLLAKDLKILSLFKVLRLVRALRPLRAINKSHGLKLVVNSLLSSLRSISNTMLICMAFFIVFAIFGVQVY